MNPDSTQATSGRDGGRIARHVGLVLVLAAVAVLTPVRSQETAALPSAVAGEGTMTLPAPIRTVSPVHPAALQQRRIGGTVEIVCLVSETGEVQEATVQSASHPEFGEAALVAVRQWLFHPATKDGKPVAMRVNVPFTFAVPEEINLEAILKRTIFREVSEPITPAEQLGSWPMPKTVVEPRYPRELRGSGKRGKAVVSLVIDREGHVINPRIVKATHPEFEMPSLAAAASMEFTPQLNAKKEKIYVSMDVQFDFRDDGRPAKPAKETPPKPAAPEAGKSTTVVPPDSI